MGELIRLDLREWITSAEAAEMMGCSVKYMPRLKYLGVLHPVKVSNRLMFRKREIERYIESHPRLGKAVNF